MGQCDTPEGIRRLKEMDSAHSLTKACARYLMPVKPRSLEYFQDLNLVTLQICSICTVNALVILCVLFARAKSSRTKAK